MVAVRPQATHGTVDRSPNAVGTGGAAATHGQLRWCAVFLGRPGEKDTGDTGKTGGDQGCVRLAE